MNILSLDTTTRRGSVALLQGEKVVAENSLQVEVTHTESLLPAIQTLLAQAGWSLGSVEGLALAIGPGSFTGLRVGLATAKGLAKGGNIPLVGISSLLALAHNALFSSIPVAALLDARRKEVYAACYQFENGNVKKILLEESALDPKVLCNTLRNFGPVVLLGDGALAYQELFKKELGSKAVFAPSPMMFLKAGWVGFLAYPLLMKQKGNDWEKLVPNYIRPSDAIPSPLVGEGRVRG